jgi:hypothetical protein
MAKRCVEILIEEFNPIELAMAHGDAPGDNVRVEMFSCCLDIRESTAPAPSGTFLKS